MIAYLNGTVLSSSEESVVLLVNGVGYELRMPESARQELPSIGETAAVYTRSLFREEDGFLLFGFTDPWQRKLFDLLITVSGVGPKLALNMMSAIDPESLARAISIRDLRRLQSVPGIGAKMAQRLSLELADKVAEISFEKRVDRLTAASMPESQLLQDLIDSLVGLGYRKQEASRAVEIAARNHPNANEQTLLREALKIASK
ncbi:MAG: Holliday junction branch migration protein RuvA [Fimbriimonadia bacterium]|nr:Holliday junction branch migration protein RuvA [Fimbriimonadia bacterium]